MNYDEAVEIASGIYWVGNEHESGPYHCNPYLLVDGDEAVVIDPGSVPDFPVVARKVISIIDPRKISYIIVNHQDPDLAGSITVFEDLIASPNLKIATGEWVSWLISHLGTRSPFYFIEKNNFKLALKSGRELRFIFTPYLHTAGCAATYDTKTKTLFSGDIFGAFLNKWTLYAGDNYLPAMAKFNGAYMPSQEIMRHSLEKIEKLDLELIAPQHGSVIKRGKIKEAVGFLKDLECGLYLKNPNLSLYPENE